jgi:putative membrane protein
MTKYYTMKNTNLLATVMLAAIGLQACHNSEKQNTGASTTTIAADSTLDTVSDVAKKKETKLTPGQTDFVLKAALGSMVEVEAGNLALQRSKNPEVKQFAQMMVSDHTKASAALQGIAKGKGLGLPATLPVQEKEKLDALQQTQGDDGFDRQYMKMMVSDHETTLTLFQLAKTYSDKELQNFASGSLPMLQMHYKQANALSTKLEKQKMNNGDYLLNLSPTKPENKK